eukprot:scaffold8204_cov177-Amphora_coffeaeformis.AAC.7
MVDTFSKDFRTFIGTYLNPTSYEDQLEYMYSAVKPFLMTYAALGSRLRVISQLGKHLPGSCNRTNKRPLYRDEDTLKCANFLLMPSPWHVKFAESGQVLKGAYTYQNLVRVMSRSQRKVLP